MLHPRDGWEWFQDLAGCLSSSPRRSWCPTWAEPFALTVGREGGKAAVIEHRCTASIGVVLFFDHEFALEDIIRWSDEAMYQAKEAGRNRIHFRT